MRCISVTEFGGPEVLKFITGAAIPKPQARQVSLREKCPYSEFFCTLFSLIRTEYGEIGDIQSECGKMRTRKTPNTDTFQAVYVINVFCK